MKRISILYEKQREFCLFDILFDHFLRHRTSRSHILPNRPESATPEIRLPNLAIPLQQLLTTVRLELPGEVGLVYHLQPRWEPGGGTCDIRQNDTDTYRN
jgi:hypothetical protein